MVSVWFLCSIFDDSTWAMIAGKFFQKTVLSSPVFSGWYAGKVNRFSLVACRLHKFWSKSKWCDKSREWPFIKNALVSHRKKRFMNSRISPRITHPKNDSAAPPPGKHGTMESKALRNSSSTAAPLWCFTGVHGPWSMTWIINTLEVTKCGRHCKRTCRIPSGWMVFASKMFL